MFFVISRYNEPIDWVKEYTTNNYLVCNKGEPLDGENIFNLPNVGSNQKDIFQFICSNYYDLPELTAFVQANPFDHCKKETFDKLIRNKTFTPLEDYSHIPEGNGHKKDFDGGYMEVNSSWYIPAHNSSYNLTCRYQSYDEFMHTYFENYVHLDWLRFAPGSQYIVEKNQILKYPEDFWYSMFYELKDSPRPTEGHIIERALWYIFKNQFQWRKIS